jgi:hypothetical protein
VAKDRAEDTCLRPCLRLQFRRLCGHSPTCSLGVEPQHAHLVCEGDIASLKFCVLEDWPVLEIFGSTGKPSMRRQTPDSRGSACIVNMDDRRGEHSDR